jgi:hypothetical protein
MAEELVEMALQEHQIPAAAVGLVPILVIPVVPVVQEL